MPTYQVTDPQSGITLKLTGNSPPTEAELEQVFASQALTKKETTPISQVPLTKQNVSNIEAVRSIPSDVPGRDFDPYDPNVRRRNPTLEEQAFGAGETALTAITGMTGGAAGHLYGTAKGIGEELVGAVTGEGSQPGSGHAERQAQEYAQDLTYTPKTEEGQRQTKALGEAASSLAAIGPMGRQLTALRPQPGSVAYLKQAVKPAKYGVKQTPLRKAGRAVIQPLETAKKIVSDIKDEGVARQNALANKIPDQRAAGYRLLENGNVVKDKRLTALITEAERQGFKKPALTSVQMASNADKNAMINMLDIVKKSKEIDNFQSRPGDVVGKVVTDQLRFVKNIRKQAGKEVDFAAKNLKGQNIDFTESLNQFRKSLDDIGVKLADDGTLDFTKSDIRGLNQPIRAIENIVDRMKQGARTGEGYMPDAYDLHTLKRFIDNNVQYGGRGKEGIPAQVEGILKKLRRDVDGALDGKFKEYDLANTKYSDSVGAIKDLEGISRSLDLGGSYADSNMGQLMRRIMSNAVSRNNVNSSVDQLYQVFTKYGGKTDNDPRVLMSFVNETERMFGSTTPMGFAGQQEQAFRQGLIQAGIGRRSIQDVAGQALERGVEAAQGINEQNAFNAMDNFLKYRYKN
jgi:hypothetical protein